MIQERADVKNIVADVVNNNGEWNMKCFYEFQKTLVSDLTDASYYTLLEMEGQLPENQKQSTCKTKPTCQSQNKLAKLGDAIAISKI